jgi:hypothetical protein
MCAVGNTQAMAQDVGTHGACLHVCGETVRLPCRSLLLTIAWCLSKVT